ncbi:EF-hand domain-containing protein [Piscinibacter sp. XHJ-5]|uniref:EF-hand domain-containing protein n=1 Tax=Piscinibacter sp. XHJ-5 TaxID=3037797 RepID=UPI0024528DAC|nr:EF-hand domain-containing protein [Piscinibacter sp. XHJ-5]
MKRLALGLMLPLAAAANDAALQTPMRDPWVPPAVRQAASAPETRGAALQAQVERKLRAAFEAAGKNTLTRDEARAAGLGWVARDFERIDRGQTGRVSFEDVKRHLRERGARL